jgi:chromosome segregation ATPase
MGLEAKSALPRRMPGTRPQMMDTDEIARIKKRANEADEAFLSHLRVMQTASVAELDRLSLRYLDLKMQRDRAEAALTAALGKRQK